MKIERPGEYRTRDGRKAVVDAVSEKRAYGWVPGEGSILPVHCWFVGGAEIRLPGAFDLIAEWREPETRKAVFVRYPNGQLAIEELAYGINRDVLVRGRGCVIIGSVVAVEGVFAEPGDAT